MYLTRNQAMRQRIRGFESHPLRHLPVCLTPIRRFLWLSALAAVALPLSALAQSGDYRVYSARIKILQAFGGPTCAGIVTDRDLRGILYLHRYADGGKLDGYVINRLQANVVHFSGPDPLHLTPKGADPLLDPPPRFSLALQDLGGNAPHGEQHILEPRPQTQLCLIDTASIQLTPVPPGADAAEGFRRARSIYEIVKAGGTVQQLQLKHEYRQAEEIEHRVMAQIETTFGGDDEYLADHLLKEASLLKAVARYAEAESAYRRAITIYANTFGVRSYEVGVAQMQLAELYMTYGNHFSEAELLFRQAVDIAEHDPEPDGALEANAAYRLASLLQVLNRTSEAEREFRHALEIFQRLRQMEMPGGASALASLGTLLNDAGRYSEAEPYLRRALEYHERMFGADAPVVGDDLGSLGNLLTVTGRYAEAEPLLRRALAIVEKAFGPEHPRVAYALNRLGLLFRKTHRYAEMVVVEERALTILQRTLGEDDVRLASTINNTALAYENVGRNEDAEKLYRRSLAMTEHGFGSDHSNVGINLMNLARVLSKTGRAGEALPLRERAFRISRTSGNATLAWSAPDALMKHYHKSDPKPELAIFYGKEAINQLQHLRSNLSTTGAEAQQSFADSVAPTYRELAEIMIGAGRLAEAQQVLAMLKESEYFDFIRRSASTDPRSTTANCTGSECGWEDRYREISDRLVKLSQEDAALAHKASRTPEEDAQKARDDADLAVARSAFDAQMVAIAAAAATPKERDDRYRSLRAGTVSLRDTIKRLGHGAVLVQYVIMDDRTHILLTTPDVVIARETLIPRTELNAKIFEFRTLLANPRADPLPKAQELYKMLLGPIAGDLRQAGARTLMLSLDDTLRYLPFAALHDGQHYLIETLRAKLADAPKDGWTVWGLGVTQPHPGFQALQGVAAELGSIVGQQGIEGKVQLDDKFTQHALQDGLDQEFPVIHIASHYQFVPGDAGKSFLLLGDGSHLTLADMKTHFEFGSVELLTLSACETAVGGGADSHGMEVEGLGEVAQEQGAKAVLASLWPVADQSTALLMQSLYRLHQENHLTKAEALQQAQLALLHGAAHGTASSGIDRGASALASTAGPASFKVDPSAPFAHPYFWAPFILMGNWL